MEHLLEVNIPHDATQAPVPRGSRLRVLHVCSQVYAVGGHTRAIQNWIDCEGEVTHSVAILWQDQLPVPPSLVAAARRTGGEVMSNTRRAFWDVVVRLRALARTHDLLVLHVHPFDVIPVVALASLPERPPIALFNHADHLFGVGYSVADAVVDIRPAGRELSLARRGVSMASSLFLPLPLKLPERRRTRAEAKAALGLRPDAVVVLSIGGEHKYRSIADLDFVGAHAALLEEFPQVTLVVVGPSPQAPYWRRWSDATAGRVSAVAATPELAPYHEAADIYVDAFPFGSLTALMEAVLWGTPAASWAAFPPELGAFVLRSNDAALASLPFAFADHARYIAQLRDLVLRREAREYLGSEMSQSIAKLHGPDAFGLQARRLYPAIADAARARGVVRAASAAEPAGIDFALSVFLSNQAQGTQA